MASLFDMFWLDRDEAEDKRPFLTSGAETLSYAQLFDRADTLYARTQRAVVVILCDRSVDTVAAYVGALRAGLVPLMLDGGMRPPALAHLLHVYQPRYMVGPATPPLPGYAPVQYMTDGHALLERRAGTDWPLHDDLALLLPTSGSTGDPKCVRITKANLDSWTRAVCDYLAMQPERTAISLLPLHYSYGLSVLHNAMQVRGRFVLSDLTLLDRDFWALIAQAGVTDLSAVPFIFETMRRIPLPDAALASLQCVTQAGGALAPKLTKLFATRFAQHHIRYFTMYGQTEASPRIAYVPPERALEKLGSVGIPIACGQVGLAGCQARTGEGELEYRGPNVCMGYARSGVDLAQGNVFAGRLLTGDRVRLDEEGFITILGRLKRFIKIHGKSVNLDYVEGLLRAQAHDCLVVGRDDRLMVCHTGDDRSAIADTLKAHMDMHPSALSVRQVEGLPLTGSGKPDYAAAAAVFAEG